MSRIKISLGNTKAIERMAALTGRNTADVVGDSLALKERKL
jgi:hypothetical protein